MGPTVRWRFPRELAEDSVLIQVLTDLECGERRNISSPRLDQGEAIGPPVACWVNIVSREKSAGAVWGWSSAPIMSAGTGRRTEGSAIAGDRRQGACASGAAKLRRWPRSTMTTWSWCMPSSTRRMIRLISSWSIWKVIPWRL